MNNPKFSLGSLTNHGQVWAFYYNFQEQEWAYKLVFDDSITPIEFVHKMQDDLELIAEGESIPQSRLEIGDEIQRKGMVVGIYYYFPESSFAYVFSRNGIHSPYLNWLPEEHLFAASNGRT